MEEDLSAALAAAGALVAEAVRRRLQDAGLPDDVCVSAAGGRIMIASASSALREAELGRPGAPPRSYVSGAAREVAADAAGLVAACLGGSIV